ncbi:Exonuclease [uncultured archaeon]|nr:Exonuclease [uncultured archaeon]
MIVVDLEMSGTDPEKCGIVEIGAVELESPKNIFSQEAKLEKEEIIYNDPTCQKTVLEVLNKTEEELRKPKRQTQKELLVNFFEWISKTPDKVFVCQNYLDILFIRLKCKKYSLAPPPVMFIDIGSVAQTKYYALYKKPLINAEGFNDMTLKKVSEFCGMLDERKSHTALEDVKFEAELISRLLNGKNLFKEYKQFKIPPHLLK